MNYNLHTSKIITEHQGIYTAGGAVSSLNLVLCLVEKYNGREGALYCAKVLQIDIDKNSQAPFILFEGLKGHKDDTIRNVQDFIEQHIGDRLTVDLFVATLCHGQDQFFQTKWLDIFRVTPTDVEMRRIELIRA